LGKVWWRREPTSPEGLNELIALVRDIGGMLMGIDAKLEEIVELLRGDDDEGHRADT
jgi:hypothetical protein